MTESPDTAMTLAVHDGGQLRAVAGVAEGDPISFAAELVMDDVYRLDGGARRRPLALAPVETEPGTFVVARPEGARTVHLDSCLTFMAPGGSTLDVLLFVEVDDGAVAAIHLLPLATLAPEVDYRLVGIDRETGPARLAEVACVSFTRGTRITLANGEQRPIEALQVGDRVLTRDDGAQPVRWMGRRTVRAVGDVAPVTIRAGALNNENDLVVSPDHRVLVYQRRDRLGAGRSEVLVKVRHLINGDTVVQQEGGFVEYFQLIFDEHQIIYAEGIAAESLLVDPRTRPALPPEAGEGHGPRRHLSYEIGRELLTGRDGVAELKKASTS